MSGGERQQPEAVWSQLVEFWHRYDEMEARLTRPVSERMLDMARVSTGMHVLDVACGRGEPAVPAAHRVGASGWVLGVDMVEGNLQTARARANQEGLRNIEFQVADAEALEVGEKSFDVATLRWGLMYMREPERALRSIHRALKPGGVLVLASWAEPARVPFSSLPRSVFERYLDLPAPDPDAPSVFRHADRARLDAALQRNGFSVEASKEMEIPVVEAPDGRGIVAWVRGMAVGWVKLVSELPEAQQRAWEEELAAEAEKYRIGDKVALGGVTRLTLARASDH